MLVLQGSEKSFLEVAKKMDFQILEFNGESDHIHALVEFPPKLSVSTIVNAMMRSFQSSIRSSRLSKAIWERRSMES